MGIFYALDGWRASTKDVPFFKSKRFTNFRVVVLGAITTPLLRLAFGDPPTVVRLLAVYVISFTISAIVVVSVVFIGIAVKFYRMRKLGYYTVPPPPFSPAFDYLYYGYDYHKQSFERAAKASTIKPARLKQYLQRFLPRYIGQITNSIAALSGYLDMPFESKRKLKPEITRQILLSIEGAVARHFEHQGANLKINVNYMQAIPHTEMNEKLWKRVKFLHGDKNRYEYFLSIEQYANAEGAENFILPVESKDRVSGSLPGAPYAFLQNSSVVIDDTHNIEFPEDLDSEVIDNIKEYFNQKDFRSFACINIIPKNSGEKPTGVLNVESNKPRIFGDTDEEKENLARMLQPFCALLGIVISNQSESTTQ